MFDDVLRNADRLTTYRQICAQVAREDGSDCLLHVEAVHGRVGVGLSPQHVAVARRRRSWSTTGMRILPGMEGAFTYREGGENTFMPDPSIDERCPGRLAAVIGGVINTCGH